MSTLTYCKGLPTPIDELNAIGMSKFEMFLNDYSVIFYKASCETVNRLLRNEKFNKSSWNTYLQKQYKLNKRQANGVIASSSGRVDSASECRKLHIKTLEGKLKSAKAWLKKSVRKINSAKKFYLKKNWAKSKTSCLLLKTCHIKYKSTNYNHLKFQIHNKKRRIHYLTNQINHLKIKPIRVKVPRWDCFVVGSKDETFGNQVCQWDGEYLSFRVPYCLEKKYGKTVTTKLGNFKRNINRIPKSGAKTWHFYLKNGKWKVALQFTPVTVPSISRGLSYGAIGIDLNPSSVDWAYVDYHGNLKDQGQITLEQGLPRGKQQAQIVKVCLKLAKLATFYKCPIVCEELDFSKKKESLKEKSRKLARMLSLWAYSEFFKQLSSICTNRGIYLKTVNPSYSSLIGLVKYCRQYGISSGVAAALAIARRGMRLTEKIPNSITAYLGVKPGKHVWSHWNKLNKLIKSCTEISNRHSYYSISNWDFLVKESKLDKDTKST